MSESPAVAVPVLTAVSDRSLTGVGGWLAWFCVGQGAAAVMQIVSLPSLWSETKATLGAASLLPLALPLGLLESAFHLGQIIGPALGLWMVWQRKRETRLFWIVYLLFVALYVVVDYAGGLVLQRQMTSVFAAEIVAQVKTAMSSVAKQNFRLLAGALLWIAYWLRSERVRQTFTAA